MKAIALKYSQQEMFALQELYESTVCEDRSKEIEDRLLIALLLNVYKKIRQKTIEIKPKYTLKYTAAEAIAFVLYFQKIPAETPYEQRLIYMTIEATDRNIL